jgi:hypothetical protein
MEGIFNSVDFDKPFEIDDNAEGSGVPKATEEVDDIEQPDSNEINNEEKGKEKDDKKEDDLIEISDEINNEDTNNTNNNEDEKDSEESESNENEESPLTTYATALKEEGVLPNLNLEDFDGTVEGLIEAQRRQFEEQVDEYKKSLPNEVREIINNYEEGVPLIDLIEAKSKEIEYGSITDEAINGNKETQKRLIRDLFKSKGLKDVRIDKMIDAFDSTGSLAEEALTAKEELVELQTEDIKDKKVKQAEEAKVFAKQQDAQVNNLFTAINDTNEIIPNMKLNKTMREKIFKNMVEPAEIDKNGNQVSKIMKIRSNDPVSFDVTLNYLAELGVFEGKWDKIVSKQKSNAIKDLENNIKSNQTSLSNKPKKTAKSEELLESMRKSFS